MEGKIITLQDGHKLYVVKRRWTDEEEKQHDNGEESGISWIGELIEDEDSGDGWCRDEEIPEDYVARYSDRYWAFTASEVESDPIYEIY